MGWLDRLAGVHLNFVIFPGPRGAAVQEPANNNKEQALSQEGWSRAERKIEGENGKHNGVILPEIYWQRHPERPYLPFARANP